MDIAASIVELHKNKISHRYLTIESFFINSENHLVLNDITPLNRFIIDKKYNIIYASPEECRGEIKPFESDMWSIGIIIYTLIFNSPPFHTLNDLFLYINGQYVINYKDLDKPLVNILNGLLNINEKERLTASELLDQVSIVPQLSSSSLSSSSPPSSSLIILKTGQSSKSIEEENNNENSSQLKDENNDNDSKNENIYDNENENEEEEEEREKENENDNNHEESGEIEESTGSNTLSSVLKKFKVYYLLLF